MDIYILFFINLIFIFMVNLIGGKEALLCSLFFILFIFYKNRDNKQLLFYFLFTLILSINYNFRTLEHLENKNIYNFKIQSIDNFSRVIKVQNKYIKPKYHFYFDSIFQDGEYDIIGKINNLDKKNINIEVISYTKNYNSIRHKLYEYVEQLITPYPYDFQNFTKAILLGRKEVLSEEIRNKFNYTGTSHILVISGLHIGIIIFTILFLLKNLPYQTRYILTAIILTIYCYGIGFTPSVLRAYIMGIIFLGSKIFYEESEIEKSLIVAFIVSTFINPYVIRSLSYEMSYLALVGILFLYPKIKILLEDYIPKKIINSKILNFLILSFSIQLILTPIFLYNFRVLPLFSFFTNLLVIPLGSIIVQFLFFGLLLSFINLSFLIMPFTYYLYRLLIIIINIFYHIPFLTLNFYTKISFLLYVFLYAILMLIILYKKEKILKYWFVILIAILLVFINLRQRKDNIDFKFGYYRNIPNKILILNKNLNKNEFFLLRDSKLFKLDYIILNKEIQVDILKSLYPNAKFIILKKDEKIDINNEIFINQNGKIIIQNHNKNNYK